jgi:hypothetical protein
VGREEALEGNKKYLVCIIVYVRVQKMENDECVICLDLLGDRPVAWMPCAHVYHGDCIDAWLFKLYTTQRPSACPVCHLSPDDDNNNNNKVDDKVDDKVETTIVAEVGGVSSRTRSKKQPQQLYIAPPCSLV